ncbi:MAG: thiamine phosphate synthase [Myxococcales bacterium]|nr:thiamine phosphate synthase [Polyangiaceae bacterium]MDW8249004.1 thiamine phosphate synthase [Myxococcales bacterium]
MIPAPPARLEAPLLLCLPDLSLAPEEPWLEALSALASRLPQGSVAAQIRLPGATGRRLLRWAERLHQALPSLPLIINDRLDVAAALGARAVHLGRTSVGVGEARALLGSDLWVSRSCHDLAELEQASREGANAALLSPIFSSPGKGAPLGMETLRAACAAFPSLPILALGGIGPDHVGDCLAAGARGVAAIRSVLSPERWPVSFLRVEDR